MKKIKFFYIFFMVLLLSSITGCNDQKDSAEKTFIDNHKKALLFAVHPYDNPSSLVRRFTPLCHYLSKKLGQPVKLYLTHSYGDQIRQIAQGSVDLAYMGPTPYLRAQDNYLKPHLKQSLLSIQIIAGEVLNSDPNYYSVLVVPSNSPLNKVADLKDHKIAFGSPRSFGSYFVPRMLLLQSGIQLTDIKDYEFLNRHERVALAVIHGDFDAGGLRKDIADIYRDRGLRIIAQSSPLPPHVIVARPNLDKKIINTIRRALLQPTADSKKAFQAFSLGGSSSSFIQTKDADFNSARQVLKLLETSPGVKEVKEINHEE